MNIDALLKEATEHMVNRQGKHETNRNSPKQR